MAPAREICADDGQACGAASPCLHDFQEGNGDYVKGVVGLSKGLQKVWSAYPVVFTVLSDVPEEHREILEGQGCLVRDIELVCPLENQIQFTMEYYVINYSKPRIWDFVEYEKMIYLDGDIQVYNNIDHQFELPDGQFYVVMDCFCKKTWSHSPQYKIGYCQPSPDYPVNTLRLNMYFGNIYKPIPLTYNLVLTMLWCHPENVELEKVKVVHYCITALSESRAIQYVMVPSTVFDLAPQTVGAARPTTMY